MRLSPGWLCLWGAAALLAGFARTQAPVVVAAVGGWDVGPEERAIKQGIELAVQQVNDSGGIKGRRLEVQFKDDRNDNQLAAQVAQQLVADPTVVAVIGHTRSDPTLVAMKVYDGVMPVVSARLSSPDITGLSRWVFQLVPADSAYSATVTAFAERRNSRRAVLLFNNTARGRAQAFFFKQLYRGEVLGMDPVGFPVPPAGDMAIFAQWHKLQTPDLVFLPIGAERAQEYVRAAQQEGLSAAVIGWDVWAPITRDPSLPGEFYRLVPFDLGANRPETQRFLSALQARGAAPDHFAALGYDALRLIAVAARTSATRDGIREAIAAYTSNRTFPGVIGPIYFGQDGNVVGPQPVVVPLSSAPRTSTGS